MALSVFERGFDSTRPASDRKTIHERIALVKDCLGDDDVVKKGASVCVCFPQRARNIELNAKFNIVS